MMADKSVLDVAMLPFVESDGRRGLRLMNAVEGELIVIFSTSARSVASSIANIITASSRFVWPLRPLAAFLVALSRKLL
jgi:hypothetical protein